MTEVDEDQTIAYVTSGAIEVKYTVFTSSPQSTRTVLSGTTMPFTGKECVHKLANGL